MRRVRELMEQDLLTLSPDMSLPEAIRLLAQRQLDGAPVLECGRMVGCFWAQDAMAQILDAQADRRPRQVRDLVRHGVRGVPPDAELRSTLAQMRRVGIPWLPVLEQGRLLGILFAPDLASAPLPSGPPSVRTMAPTH
ncbi:MAG TPA: CBS domain-containing protein [Gemmatimonadaceae bacterium]|nr:CBS domain-containing protein [Gemmatimonadaceae bacterium]